MAEICVSESDLGLYQKMIWFPVSLLYSEEAQGVLWDNSEIWNYTKKIVYHNLKPFLHSPLQSLGIDIALSDLHITSGEHFLHSLRLPGIVTHSLEVEKPWQVKRPP